MKKWVVLIIGTIVFFLLNILLDMAFGNSIDLASAIISAVVWLVIWIVLYMTKIIRFR